MTYLTVSRDALAKTIWEASRADEGTISYLGANVVADALIASGAVIPVDCLADDEALVERMRELDHAFTRRMFRRALRALFIALTERSQR